MKRGEIWWASLPEPIVSEPGYRRPVVIVQSNEFNASLIRTIIAATITTNLKLAEAPGNVLLPRKLSRLPLDSVVNISQVVTLDRLFLVKRVSALPTDIIAQINDGLKLVLAL